MDLLPVTYFALQDVKTGKRTLITQDGGAQARDGKCLRLLMIQTGVGMSSEATVLYGLLSSLQSTDSGLDTLLLQGVGSEASAEAAKLFGGLPRVCLRKLPVGTLGVATTGRAAQAAKLIDAGRLRLMRPSLIRHARTFHPCLVYSAQQRWDTAIADPIARALKIPYLIHLHYNVGPWLGSGALQALLHADTIVAVSDAVRNSAIEYGVAPDRIMTVYNSVVIPPHKSSDDRVTARMRLRNELGIPASSTIVGMVARLSEWKGQSEVLDSMLPVWVEHSGVHLVFVGAEDSTGIGLTTKLEQRARAAGLSDHVHLLGLRSDVPELLDAMDIFVHPSRNDPCPLAVLEAMAHGLPVVAWREGGVAYQVDDERTGILVPPLQIQSLREAITRLILSPDLRSMMGNAARERAAVMFSPTSMSASFQEIFERVAAKARKE